MTKWFNFGVRITDDTKREEIINTLEDLGLELYSDRDEGVKAGSSDRKFKDSNVVLDALQPYKNAIYGVIQVEANDTADTAHSSVYKVENGSFEYQVNQSETSGGENSRYNWPGTRLDGLRVDGGKYY